MLFYPRATPRPPLSFLSSFLQPSNCQFYLQQSCHLVVLSCNVYSMLNSFYSRSSYLTQNMLFIDYKRGFYVFSAYLTENSFSTYVVTMATIK
jgi:hypothetical protein